MARNCIILHGCPSDEERAMNPERRTYDKHWIPWLKRELSSRGIEALTPLMPEPWRPSYEAFRSAFDALPISEESTLVGHSCGAAFLVRWLGDSKRRVEKLILVAPWKSGETAEQRAFYEYAIDRTIPERITDIIMFTSDTEEEDGKKSLTLFHDALGGRIVSLPNHGHYTMGDMGTEEFPELLDVIKA